MVVKKVNMLLNIGVMKFLNCAVKLRDEIPSKVHRKLFILGVVRLVVFCLALY